MYIYTKEPNCQDKVEVQALKPPVPVHSTKAAIIDYEKLFVRM